MVKVDQRRFAEAVPWLEKSVSTPALADMGELPYRMMGYCYLATGKSPRGYTPSFCLYQIQYCFLSFCVRPQ